jgi:signal transduction histidine kinase
MRTRARPRPRREHLGAVVAVAAPAAVGRSVLGRGAGSTFQPGVGALMSARALGREAGSPLAVAQVIAVADATRRGIERDLHDGIQQQLVSLALRVRAVEAMVPAELVELRAELSHLVDEHTNLLDQLREIAHGIHPAILSQDGLEPALKALARRSPIPVELKVRADARLPEEVELAAYYIVAEALTNTAKYARASLAHVLVETRGPTLRIAVCDDGVGGADPARGTGLLGLTQRAHAIGGTVSLHSPPAAGTLLDAELPLGEKSRHPARIPPPPGRDGLSRGSERACSSQGRPACPA